MKYDMVPMSPEDRETVINIFNHYIENSFAAYPERKVPYEFFDLFLGIQPDIPLSPQRMKTTISWVSGCFTRTPRCPPWQEPPK